MTLPTVTASEVRTALLLRDEIALLDVRHEAFFATGHPLFAANMAADRIALYATALAWDDPRDMPVWGDRYAVHAAEHFAGSPYDQDAFIRGCVLILVDLGRVQPGFRR